MTVCVLGLGISPGIALGPALPLEQRRLDVMQRTLAEDAIDAEIARYRAAVLHARTQLRQIREQVARRAPSEIAEFVDTHALMLDDSSLTDAPVEIIRDKHCNAEWALQQHRDSLAVAFDAMSDPYLRSRIIDVDQVVDRVLAGLRTQQPESGGDVDYAGAIIVADDIPPAEVALMHQGGVAGLVTEHGGPLSHTAILARSLRIPAVVGVRRAREIFRRDEPLVIDGVRGLVMADVHARVRRHYETRQQDERQRLRNLGRLKHQPAVTRDGVDVNLRANVELPQDLEVAAEAAADGVGLYRTEFLFMNREALPDEEEQFEAYRHVVQALAGAPVTIRTLDLGADKQVDGGRLETGPVASNPALGLRAIRLCLHDQSLFRPQLRAILRAARYGEVRMLIPMLSNVGELFQVKNLVRAVAEDLAREGIDHNPKIPIGGMIEVPAAAISARLFAKYLDFLSIGTNDLIQYTLAVDRVVDEVNYLYDPLHPSILRLLQITLDAGRKAGTPVAMCGEMAGDPRFTRLLLGMGLTDFSMHPATLLEVKSVVKETDVSAARDLTKRILRASNPARIAELLRTLNQAA